MEYITWQMTTQIILMGYSLNVVVLVFAFLYSAYYALKLGDSAIPKMQEIERLQEKRRKEGISNGIQYNILVPFGLAYWTLVFFVSYVGYKGDVFDKMINYYTHN